MVAKASPFVHHFALIPTRIFLLPLRASDHFTQSGDMWLSGDMWPTYYTAQLNQGYVMLQGLFKINLRVWLGVLDIDTLKFFHL